MALKIIDRKVDGVSVLALDGRVVFGEEATSLRDRVKGLIDSGDKKLVLNMNNVTFIDSAGLGALVSAHHAAGSNGGILRLCHLGSKFTQMLKMTNMHTVLQVSETEVDAVLSFSK